ncbi:MAG: RecX family transcriptional regulator [bacterium]|nr:RecX family transcriptional regulator [bacterium]
MDGAGADIRLLSLERGESEARLALSDGTVLELASASLPPDLPACGDVVPPALLAALHEAALRKRIARRLFRELDRRLRTRADLRVRLLAADFPPGPVDEVLDRFAETGIHSDRRFAEAWCRDALRAKPVGRRLLADRLARSGVPSDLARTVAAEQLPADDEAELARTAARSWWRRQRGEADARALARGQRFLIGRGFPPGTAGDAVRATAPGRGVDGGEPA